MKKMFILLFFVSSLFGQNAEESEMIKQKKTIEKLQKENLQLKEKIEKLQEQKIEVLLEQKNKQKTILERITLLEELLQKEITQRKTANEIIEKKMENSESLIKVSYLQNSYQEARSNKYYNKELSNNRRDFSFVKERNDSILKITYCDNFYSSGGKNIYIKIHIDDKEVFSHTISSPSNGEIHIPSTVTGYIENIPSGSHEIKITCPTVHIGYQTSIMLTVEEFTASKVHINQMK